MDSYADALRVVFVCQAAVNFFCFLCCLPIQENPLPCVLPPLLALPLAALTLGAFELFFGYGFGDVLAAGRGTHEEQEEAYRKRRDTLSRTDSENSS